MNRHLISILLLMIVVNINLFGQTRSKVDSISMIHLHTLDFGFDAFKPFLAKKDGKGYILTVGYEYSNKMHLFYRLNVDGGYYGSIYEVCSYKKHVQDYYGIGLIPEIKYYPIKRHRDTYGFYVSVYTGAKLIYKKDSYYENEELNWQNNNWGALFWYAGLGIGYKIPVYKGLFIEPSHGFSIGDQTFEYFNYCDKGMFEFIDGLQYLNLHTRLQLKIGYIFNL
ncbi:MAG TPA: hypothetical protein VJY41_06375 [Prolixibacteraceae bacterium]|nr:hypothetical protein [Prolixibacteraceae bacterium]